MSHVILGHNFNGHGDGNGNGIGNGDGIGNGNGGGGRVSWCSPFVFPGFQFFIHLDSTEL